MNIERKIADVEVVRRATIAEALEACYGTSPLNKGRRFWQDDPSSELAELLEKPLYQECEGPNRYARTLALVAVKTEMKAGEWYRLLKKEGYYPASINEALSYVFLLAAEGIKVEHVFHLGTVLRNEAYQEFRLLTTKSGSAELVPFYPAQTRLRSHYRIIIAEEPGKYVKK